MRRNGEPKPCRKWKSPPFPKARQLLCYLVHTSVHEDSFPSCLSAEGSVRNILLSEQLGQLFYIGFRNHGLYS